MALQAHFDTLVAFGDSFSSQCGFDMGPTRMRWSDFSHGLHNNLILRDCGLSGGWNYLNFLTDCTTDGIDPLECPVKLVDLAYGGAVTYKNSSLFEGIETVDLSGALQLPGQLAQWNEHVRPELSYNLDHTLGVIWFGINDVHLFLARNLEKALEDKHATMLEDIIETHLDVIGATVDQLHTDGLRNIMIPNISLDVSGAAGLINTWNKLLRLRIEEWTETYEDSIFYEFDTYSMFNQFQAHPERYGFTNIEDACFGAENDDGPIDCADTLSGYLMMDWIHWTSHAHLIMSQLMEQSILQHLESSQRRKSSGAFWIMAHLDASTSRFATLVGALLMISISFALGWLINQRRATVHTDQMYAAIKDEESTTCDR